MTREVRRRFWIEVGLATASGSLFILTVAWHDWIEALSGFDPDGHSGVLEWAIVAALFVVTLLFGFLARIEWRRAALAGA